MNASEITPEFRRANRLALVLRVRRQACGLSKCALAAKARLDRTYVNELERGNHSPTFGVLWRLAEAFGTPLSELIAEVERAADDRVGDQTEPPGPAPVSS